MPAATLADFLWEVLAFMHPLAAGFCSLLLIVQLFIPGLKQETLLFNSLSSLISSFLPRYFDGNWITVSQTIPTFDSFSISHTAKFSLLCCMYLGSTHSSTFSTSLAHSLPLPMHPLLPQQLYLEGIKQSLPLSVPATGKLSGLVHLSFQGASCSSRAVSQALSTGRL